MDKVHRMSIDVVKDALLWCFIINYCVLLIWFLVIRFAGHRLYFMARWVHLSNEQFDVGNYTVMALYKIGIALFNLVPYIALRIVTG